MAPQARNEQQRLIAEAADWLARLDSGSADPAAFARWRDADPARASAFAQVARTWGLMDRLRVDVPAPPPAAHSVLSRRGWLRAAGIAGLTVTGGALFGWALFRPAYASTGIGERRRLTLEDGSTVDLNTDSAISWRFSESERLLWLERGEAALTIVADPARPFYFRAGSARTAMAAGEFNVRRHADALDLRVLRGEALVDGPAPEPMPVAAHHSLLVTASEAVARQMSDSDIASTTAWQRGEIIFDGTPLATAVAEFNRYLRRRLVIADPALGNLRLGGRFTSTDPTAFLKALEGAFGVQVVEADPSTVLLSRGTPRRLGEGSKK